MEQIMVLLEEKVRIREAEHKAKINSRLPKTIICPKCDGPNAFINDCCEFCGCRLDKSKYYTDEYYENPEGEVTTPTNDSYTFHYIFSFLIPLVGFIVGAIMLANDNLEKRSAGKTCIILGIVSTVISSIFFAF